MADRTTDGEDPFVLHAWIDESMHVTDDNEFMYIIAAAVGSPTDCDDIRDALRDLLPKGKPRLHWRDEDDRLKRSIAKTIGDADFHGRLVIGMRADPKKQERARRKCMEVLLVELERLGVTQVWIESRTPSLNRRDVQMVDALRSARVITQAIRVDFEVPSKEPMLWIPDALAGATGMARKGAEAEYREAMGRGIEEHEISIRANPA